MNSKMFKSALAALAAVSALTLSAPAQAAGGAGHVEDISFSFEGPFGTFDKAQLQRGWQVFREVCASCHGIQYASPRELTMENGPGFSADQVKAFLADSGWEVIDREGEPGDTRPIEMSDRFPPVTSAAAPDLSLMAKSRAGFHGPLGSGINQLFRGIGGAEYIYSLMIGYVDPPACAPDEFDGYYNAAFGAGGVPESCMDHGHSTITGSWIGMPPPLTDEGVEYQDGTPATVEQQSEDIAAFLMWVAEPHMMDRKAAGVRNVGFLVILSVLLYLTNKALWAPIKKKKSA